MRAKSDHTYRMHTVPPVPEIFDFIAAHTGNPQAQMFRDFNMGAGYAVYLPPHQTELAIGVVASCGLKAWQAGTVEDGPKQVIIEPNGITFDKDSLKFR